MMICDRILLVVVPIVFILAAVLAMLYGYREDVEAFDLNAGQYNSPLPLPYVGAAVPTSAAQWATISNSGTQIVPISVSASGKTSGSISCSLYSSQLSGEQVCFNVSITVPGR